MLEDEEPIVKYYKKDFQQKNEMEEISELEKVVVQPLWPSDVTVEETEYLLEQGREYTVNLKIYNFSKSSMTVSFECDTTSQLTITKAPAGARLSPGATVNSSITFKVNEDSCPMSGGMMIIKPIVKKKAIAPVVSHFRISDTNIQDVISETKSFDYFYNPSNWQNNSTGNLSVSGNNKTIVFNNKFRSNATACYTYPYINMNEDLSDYKGFYFDVSCDDEEYMCNGNVYVNGILASYGLLTNMPTRVFVPFDKMIGLDSSSITKIDIGFTKHSRFPKEVNVTVSNINFYKVDIEEVYKVPTIEIDMDSGLIWRIGSQPETLRAELSDKLNDVKVYINYKEYTDFTLDDNGLGVTVNISNLDYGAKDIIITGRDRFNFAVYDKVDFYLSNFGEYLLKGTFF